VRRALHGNGRRRRDLVLLRLSALEPAPSVTRSVSAARASAIGHSPAELFALRREAVEIDRQVRLFFLELDERTTPPGADAAFLQRLLRLTYALFQRIEVRAAYGLRRLVPTLRSEVATQAGLRESLIEVSALFDELIDRHLGASDERVDWAFEQFTVGACSTFHRDPLKHRALLTCGAPNGSEFFKLGELALLCLEQGVASELWTRLLPTLVRCTHLFAELAEPPVPGEARMTGANNYTFRQGRYCLLEWRQARHAQYDPLLSLPAAQRTDVLAQRYTSILAQAFADTEVLATDLVESSRPLEHAVVLERRFSELSA